MKENIIEVKELTKDYKNNRGLFDLSFALKKGEFCGLIGENGAGKSTLMRLLMGFIKPDKGHIYINGFEPFKNQEAIKEYLGYVPGEINYPDLQKGNDFLTLQAEMDPSFNKDKANYLINRLQLDISAYPKRMSKGMKQKMAIVNAFAKNKEMYLLDEPTTGLDPLMREAFLELLEKEKEDGKAIFMSSNTFEEIERVCSRVIYISEGKMVTDIDITDLNKENLRVFKVKFSDIDNFSHEKNVSEVFRCKEEKNELFYAIKKDDINRFLKRISAYKINGISEYSFSLKEYMDSKLRAEHGKKKE